MPRLRRCLTLVAVAAAVCATASIASAGAVSPSLHAVKVKPHRLGGKVRHAWPAPHTKRPKTALTRWLARQVGPRTPLACRKRPKRARSRCVGTHRKGHASAASVSAPIAVAASATGRASAEKVRIGRSSGVRKLELVRSFDIPSDDPSYDRLLNWSWTYDSALTAVAFANVGMQAQAGRLLDQLSALQRKDGSIEFAFDVRTGESSRQIRSGSIAFAGLAWVNFDDQLGDDRYLDNAKLAARYLLRLRGKDGLVRGGPDVKWASTQHNIMTDILLYNLARKLNDHGDSAAGSKYEQAADDLAKAIDSELVVRDDGLYHFRQGLNDDTLPLDAQVLGGLWAGIREDNVLAEQVYKFVLDNYAVDGRSIKLSKRPATYNMTYRAKGPFSGFRPYIGRGAPDVLWFEGTAEVRFVSSLFGQPTDQLDASMNEWSSITSGDGLAPLGADRTVTGNRYNEYHVWPTAAAGAWSVIGGASNNVDWADPLKR